MISVASVTTPRSMLSLSPRWGYVHHVLSVCVAGSQSVHNELETLIAEFLGVEAAVTFGMGFGTNSCNMPTIMGPVSRQP